MLTHIVHRLLIMIPTLLAISLIIFVIIQLPPGDYFESYINQLLSQGENVDMQRIEFLRQQYGFLLRDSYRDGSRRAEAREALDRLARYWEE